MLLILASFSISLLIYLIIDALRRCNESAKKFESELNSVPYADCYLEAINVDINEYWTWVPTFLKVYLIGIVETVYITLRKRGLFTGSITQSAHESQIDELIQHHINNKEQSDSLLAVITGGDSGIGFEICKGLLDAGYQVIIGAHSEKSCEEAIKVLQRSTGSDKVFCLQLDLASFKSVRNFAAQIQEKISKKNIDLLINNAGIMNVPYHMTEDGFESQCEINFLSPMLLTRSLLPYINSQNGRVLFASSSTLYTVNDLNLDMPLKPYSYNGLDHYAHSKACVAQLVPRLAKTTSAKIYSYHPGTVRTKLFATTTVFNLPLVSKIFKYIMLSPKEGSQTPLYLSLTKGLKDSGSYWANERKQKLPSIHVNGKNDIEELWLDTMDKIGIKK